MKSNTLIVLKIYDQYLPDMTIRPVATPARTLYSGGSNSPTKTHWRGLAPKITKYSAKHYLIHFGVLVKHTCSIREHE